MQRREVANLWNILKTKDAYHFSDLASWIGGFECEMSLFHEIFAKINTTVYKICNLTDLTNKEIGNN